MVLDSPWQTLSEWALDLVSLSREVFVDSLLGRGRSCFQERHLKRRS